MTTIFKNSLRRLLLKNHPASWKKLLKKKKRCLYAGQITRKEEFPEYFGINPFLRDPNHINHDIQYPMPIPSESIDVYQSEDVFEHIPYEKLEQILNDIFRVLKKGGLFRLSLPDYRFDLYQNRSLKNDEGNIYFDPEAGGRFLDGQVIEGGHLWFPKYELVQNLIEKSSFRNSQIRFLHYNTESKSVTHPIDYSLGMIKRTPDHDSRAQNPYRAISIVVDIIK